MPLEKDLEQNLELGRGLPVGGLLVPTEVELDGDSLLWGFGPTSRRVAPPPTLLQDFLGLADAPTDQMRDFARRWGVLGTCEHKLPHTHRATFLETYVPGPSSRPYFPTIGPGCTELDLWTDQESAEWSGRDLLESWRHFARQGIALLSIVHQLQLARDPHERDLEIVLEWNSGLELDNWRQSRRNRKRMWEHVGSVVDQWLRLGDVRPYLTWRADGGVARLAPLDFRLGGSLFGVLTVQLMFSIFQSDGLAICKGCGIPFIPGRRPTLGRRTYCRRCGKGKVAGRDAARDYRARKAMAVRLIGEGVSVQVIAERVGSRAETVTGWLGAATKHN